MPSVQRSGEEGVHDALDRPSNEAAESPLAQPISGRRSLTDAAFSAVKTILFESQDTTPHTAAYHVSTAKRAGTFPLCSAVI